MKTPVTDTFILNKGRIRKTADALGTSTVAVSSLLFREIVALREENKALRSRAARREEEIEAAVIMLGGRP